MKMFKINKKLLAFLIVGFGAVVTSCNYDEKNQIDGQGPSFVRMQVAPNDYGINFTVAAFDAVPQERAILLINRDAVSEGDLKTTVKVDFSLDDSFLRVLNDSLMQTQIKDAFEADGTVLEPGVDDFDTFNILPPDTYAWAAEGLSGQTLTFAPGEAVKELAINLDPTTLSFTTLYALPIRLSNPVGSAKVSDGFGYAAVQVIVKNQYDAKYTVTGTLTDLQVPTIDGSCVYPYDVFMITNGASQVNVFDLYYSDYYHLICSGGGTSVYGNVAVVFNFDSNNNVTSVENFYTDPLPRGRTLELDPSGINKFDPVTKTLKVKYWLNQANGTQPHRTYFDETYTYKGPR